VRWIQNPQDYLPHTRMPNFSLRQDEAVAIALLWSVSKEEGDKWTAENPFAGRRERKRQGHGRQRKSPGGIHRLQGMSRICRGRVFHSQGKDKEIVPNLKNIAAKAMPAGCTIGSRTHRITTPLRGCRACAFPIRSRLSPLYLMTWGGSSEPIAGLRNS
jgi:hypothetical protein